MIQVLVLKELMVLYGRWIVGEAGITLYTLGAIKEIPNHLNNTESYDSDVALILSE